MGKRTTAVALATIALALGGSLGPARAQLTPPTGGGAGAAVTDLTARGAGTADRVAAAALLAGHGVTPVRLGDTADPVTVLVDGARRADLLRRQALAAMTGEAWATAAHGAREAIHLVDVDIDPSTRRPTLTVDPARWEATRSGLEAMHVDHGAMWQATYILAVAADRATALIEAGAPLSARRGPTPFGEIVVDDGSDPAACDDTYEGAAFVVIDTCGSDVYAAPAGAADGLSAVPIAIVIDTEGDDVALPAPEGSGVPALGAAVNGGLTLVVDLDGADRRTPLPPGSPSEFGAGGLISGAGRLAGYAVMVDRGPGDDDYRVLGFTEPAKNGAGFFNGVGLLIDEAGNDRYGGDTFQQGAGWFGSAFGGLVDLAGDDVYRDISTYAQGSGGVGGVGLLVDAAGADDYAASSVVEQGAGDCGGFGALIDLAGDDRYDEPAGFSQGYGGSTICTDEFGRGVTDLVLELVPAGLGDRVPPEVRQALNKGAGGTGLLLDAAGNEHYRSSWVSQGVHLGAGAGVLADLAGDDRYEADQCSQAFGDARVDGDCAFDQAGGLPLAGAAVLADADGDDSYRLSGGPGHHGQGAGWGSAVVLVDGGGDDSYTAGVVDSGGPQARGSTGVAVDLEGDPTNTDPGSYDEGYDDGYWDCYHQQWSHGYDAGFADGQAGHPSADPDPGPGYSPDGGPGYAEGYDDGCAEGGQFAYAEGYGWGYQDGSPAGYDEGYGDGYWTCWDEQWWVGYDAGWADAEASEPSADPDPGPGYSPDGGATYDEGYAEGCAEGSQAGYAEGYQTGYADGSAA